MKYKQLANRVKSTLTSHMAVNALHPRRSGSLDNLYLLGIAGRELRGNTGCIENGNPTLVACYGIVIWYHGFNVT